MLTNNVRIMANSFLASPDNSGGGLAHPFGKTLMLRLPRTSIPSFRRNSLSTTSL